MPFGFLLISQKPTGHFTAIGIRGYLGWAERFSFFACKSTANLPQKPPCTSHGLASGARGSGHLSSTTPHACLCMPCHPISRIHEDLDMHGFLNKGGWGRDRLARRPANTTTSTTRNLLHWVCRITHNAGRARADGGEEVRDRAVWLIRPLSFAGGQGIATIDSDGYLPWFSLFRSLVCQRQYFICPSGVVVSPVPRLLLTSHCRCRVCHSSLVTHSGMEATGFEPLATEAKPDAKRPPSHPTQTGFLLLILQTKRADGAEGHRNTSLLTAHSENCGVSSFRRLLAGRSGTQVSSVMVSRSDRQSLGQPYLPSIHD
ncbi:hypothetical protein EV126DRAFT_129499 [Verticillium dahliae]|nr:hypothetical protein EV126DRAFT_129499 [Verticillium dahliae]